MRTGYRDWLQANYQDGTVTTQISEARRLEGAYGDLDEHLDRDEFGSILATLAYSPADKVAGKPNPSRIPIEGNNLYEGLAHLRSALSYYRRFRTAAGSGKESIAVWPELDTMRALF